MCVITIRQPGGTYFRSIAKQQMLQNDDGSGFMYARNGRLHIHKGLWSLRDFWKQFQKHTQPSDLVVIHHRMATHGSVDEERCHPFEVNKSVGLVHNGVMSHLGSSQKEWWEDDDWYSMYYDEQSAAFRNHWDPQDAYEAQQTRRSDSQVFAEDILRPLIGLHKTWFPEKAGRFHQSMLLNNLTAGDCVAILNARGRLTYSGTWIKSEDMGLWHSNLIWKHRQGSGHASDVGWGGHQ